MLYYRYSNFNSHAHVERDASTKKRKSKMKNFNSHAHVERDINDNWSICITLISTHTLTWSVTPAFSIGFAGVCHFNSHAHVERDHAANSVIKMAQNFNSHAHVERD